MSPLSMSFFIVLPHNSLGTHQLNVPAADLAAITAIDCLWVINEYNQIMIGMCHN